MIIYSVSDTHQTFYLLILTALVAGLSRGFSGFGAALIFVPLASRFLPPQLAPAVLLVVDAVMTAPLIPKAFGLANRAAALHMAAGALIGIPLGTVVLRFLDPLLLRWLIAACAFAMFLLLVSGWRFRGEPRPALSLMAGAVSGLFSGVAQIGGPPAVAYFLGGTLSVAVARASIFLFFAASTVIALISYGLGGLINTQVLWLTLYAAPSYGLGVWLGNRAFGLASEATFRRISYGLILLAVLIGLPVW